MKRPLRASISKLFYWNEVPKGGHFAAFEQPELFVAEPRKSFAQQTTASSLSPKSRHCCRLRDPSCTQPAIAESSST